MGNVFNMIAGGGGKSEGLHAWKKYQKSVTIDNVSSEYTQYSNTTAKEFLQSLSGCEYYDADGNCKGVYEYVVKPGYGLLSGGYYMTPDGLREITIVHPTVPSINLYVVSGYTIQKTELGYVFSNTSDTYPDDGEQGGFYYEKVVDVDFSQITATAAEVLSGKTFFDSSGTLQTGTMGGVAFGTVKPASSSYLTITHNLGVKPKWFVALGTYNGSSYTHGCAYNENQSSSVYVQGRYNTTTKTVSTTQGSTSYAYMDENVITVPYYSSSYPWYTSDTIIWAAGY